MSEEWHSKRNHIAKKHPLSSRDGSGSETPKMIIPFFAECKIWYNAVIAVLLWKKLTLLKLREGKRSSFCYSFFSFCGLPHFYLPILIYVEIKSWANIAIKLDNVIHINKSGVIGCSPLLLFLFIVVVTYLFFQQGYFDKIFLLFVAKSPQKVDLSMFFYS